MRALAQIRKMPCCVAETDSPIFNSRQPIVDRLVERCINTLFSKLFYYGDMSRPQKFTVNLTPTQLAHLTDLTQRGKLSARVITRARILLLTHAGRTNEAIRDALGVSLATVINIRRKFCTAGLDQALYDAPRPGRPAKFDGKDRAAITSLACSAAPKGYARWSLRLLADRAVELDLVDEIARSSVFYILKKRSRPTSQTPVVPRGTERQLPVRDGAGAGRVRSPL